MWSPSSSSVVPSRDCARCGISAPQVSVCIPSIAAAWSQQCSTYQWQVHADQHLCQLLVVPEQLLFVGRNAQLLLDSLLNVSNGLLVLDPADVVAALTGSSSDNSKTGLEPCIGLYLTSQEALGYRLP